MFDPVNVTNQMQLSLNINMGCYIYFLIIQALEMSHL